MPPSPSSTFIHNICVGSCLLACLPDPLSVEIERWRRSMASAMARSLVAAVALWVLVAVAHGSPGRGEEVHAQLVAQPAKEESSLGEAVAEYMVSSRHILSADPESGVQSLSFQRALLSDSEDEEGYKGYKDLQLKQKKNKDKKKKKKVALEELKKNKYPSRRYRKIRSKKFPPGPKAYPRASPPPPYKAPYKAPKPANKPPPPPPYKAPKPANKSPPPPQYKAPKPAYKSPPPPPYKAPKPAPKSPPPRPYKAPKPAKSAPPRPYKAPKSAPPPKKAYYRRSPPLPAKPASASSPSAAQKAYLDPHNAARASKSLPPLSWDAGLEAYARAWGNHQKNSDNCALRHSSGPYGENLFWGYGKAWSAADAVAGWVEEEPYYNYASNSCAAGQMCGHYTQVMWESTTKLGCASVVCNDASLFFICSYDPPGNYIGQRPY